MRGERDGEVVEGSAQGERVRGQKSGVRGDTGLRPRLGERAWQVLSEEVDVSLTAGLSDISLLAVNLAVWR